MRRLRIAARWGFVCVCVPALAAALTVSSAAVWLWRREVDVWRGT